jgi:lambda family phage portal protein
MIGRMIDGLVGVFSPERQLKRAFYRNLISDRKRQYAAAKTPKTSDGWRPVDSGVNDLISSSSSVVRARVRQLVRDFPYFSRAVNVLTNLTVGSGITVQARVKKKDELNRAVNQSIEDGFNRWSDKADVSGKMCFFELTELAKRNMLETGEYLFIKRYRKKPGRIIPYALQAMEPERLASYGVKPTGANSLHDGVEYDTVTGEPLFYHFSANDYSGKPFRVDAKDVIHGFKTLRPGQVRGISMFTPVVLLSNDLADFMDATLERAKLAAKWLAFVKTDNAIQFQNARGVKQEEYKRIEDIENAIIEYLRPGESVEFGNGAMPGETFDPYITLILRMIAVGCGVSYELISGDYSGISYSTLRGIRNDLAKDLEPHQVDMVRHFCHPVYCDVLERLVMHGTVDVGFSAYLKDPYVFQRSVWMPPGMEAVDPLKESKANVDQVQNLLRSPQEICRSRGRDIEDVLDELKEFKRMCDDRGLESSKTSTAIAQNPASLGVEE